MIFFIKLTKVLEVANFRFLANFRFFILYVKVEFYTSYIQPIAKASKQIGGPRWQSGNTLASHLCGRGSIPVMAVSGKAGSCLPLVGSLQYTSLANSMYWFPLPFQLPVVI